MNLKANLQKMEVSDLKFVCKELGVSCPKTKSSIVKKLLEPLKISYRMKIIKGDHEKKIRCHDINNIKVSYKNPNFKNQKIKNECEKRDECIWILDPSTKKHNKCMSRKYIYDVRPKLLKLKEKFNNKTTKLNKFNKRIEDEYKKSKNSDELYNKKLGIMNSKMKKYIENNHGKNPSIDELMNFINLNEYPNKNIRDKYKVLSTKNQKHYKIKKYN